MAMHGPITRTLDSAACPHRCSVRRRRRCRPRRDHAPQRHVMNVVFGRCASDARYHDRATRSARRYAPPRPGSCVPARTSSTLAAGARQSSASGGCRESRRRAPETSPKHSGTRAQERDSAIGLVAAVDVLDRGLDRIERCLDVGHVHGGDTAAGNDEGEALAPTRPYSSPFSFMRADLLAGRLLGFVDVLENDHLRAIDRAFPARGRQSRPARPARRRRWHR